MSNIVDPSADKEKQTDQGMAGDEKIEITTESDQFIPELETMDLSPLHNLNYLVAVNRDDPNNIKCLASTIRGPFSFEEMCQEVGDMWRDHMHHAKVIVLEKDRKKPTRHLDAGTIGYIEANYIDIITNHVLNTALFDGEATCVAGIKESEYNEENKKEENTEDPK